MGIHDANDIQKELMSKMGICNKEYIGAFKKVAGFPTAGNAMTYFLASLNFTAAGLESFCATQSKEEVKLLRKIVKAKFDI